MKNIQKYKRKIKRKTIKSKSEYASKASPNGPHNIYVRCILIDYSKAFDTINHEILFAKLRTLSIPLLIKQWIMNFLTGRTQAVVTEGTTSNWLPISRSIVQGSGLGPMLFVVYALDLKPISA